MGTAIQWTDAVWNPTTGCSYASEGCRHCYAFTMTKRLAGMGQAKYQGGLTGKGHFNGVLKTHDDTLGIPLRWKKPGGTSAKLADAAAKASALFDAACGHFNMPLSSTISR